MTPLYLKYLQKFQNACNAFSWSVKSMESNPKGNVDEYIKQVEYMERMLFQIKRALIFFKNVGAHSSDKDPPGNA